MACPEGESKILLALGKSQSLEEPLQPNNINDLSPSDKTKLLYHVNKVTGVHCLSILPLVAPEILVIVHKNGHPSFSYCYEIITCFWFMQGLTKLLRAFIYHYSQCLTLQTRRHTPYNSLQPIKSRPIPFFILIHDFVFAFPVSTNKFNMLIFVTCKFSKRITLIERMDTWLSKQWAHAFFQCLDLLNWGFPRELITDRNPKLLSAFSTALFTKLGVKLLYSTAYYPQTNRSSECTNQTIEIALCFFVHALENLTC